MSKLISCIVLLLCGAMGVVASNSAAVVASVKKPLTVQLTPEIIFLLVLLLILVSVMSALFGTFLVWLFKLRTMKKTALRFDMVMETAAVDHQLGGALQVIIFSTNDPTIPSALSNVYKRMSSCFREIGFQVFFSDTLQIKLENLPTLIVVDWSRHPKALKQVERLYRKHKILHAPIVLYNIPDPGAITVGNRLPQTYLLGEKFRDQDLVKIAATVVEELEKAQPNVLQGIVTGDGVGEILQLIELGKRNGFLRIRDTKKQLLGELGFHLGKIVFARSARGIGDVAALDVVSFKTGHFSFSPMAVEGHNCEISATSLLMHAAQLHDEQQQGLAQVR